LAEFDYLRITQVVTNLLSNAIKFSTAEGHLYIAISQVEFNNTAALKFSLKDDGIGIPKEELENIFNKFIQSRKTKTDAGGAGLGLAICQEIIALHDGRIWVGKAAEGGALFQFVIPVKK
jgi:signal transduction histidine kinase